MKSLSRILLASMFAFFFSALWAQEGEIQTEATGGITFFEGTWEEAVAEAQKENKYLMIDAYTDWCHWCKVMDKNTFSETEVGIFFDEHIVAYKMDMEKGRGILMSMKYRVNSFPTFLFFSAEGPLVARVNGYQEPARFLETLRTEVMNPEKHFEHPGDPANLEVNFPEFYKLSYKQGKERKMPAEDEVIAFLDEQEDLFGEVSWAVMSRFGFPGRYRQHFLENLATYKRHYGNEAGSQIERMVYGMVMKAAKEKSEDQLNEAIEMGTQHLEGQNPEVLSLFYHMLYDQRVGDWAAYGRHAVEMMDSFGERSNAQINSYSWTIYLNVEDKEVVKKATSWMAEVIKTEPSYAYLDTYAALLYKSGDMKKAEKYAKEAIAVGKKNGDKVEETEALLKKIKDK